jgi:hypothetical protein
VIVTGATRHALKPQLLRSVVDIATSRSILQNPTRSSARALQSGSSSTWCSRRSSEIKNSLRNYDTGRAIKLLTPKVVGYTAVAHALTS